MICQFPGVARAGLEVMDAYERPVLFNNTFQDIEHFTSLTTTALTNTVVEDSLFLFAGSSNSRLHQVNYMRTSEA